MHQKPVGVIQYWCHGRNLEMVHSFMTLQQFFVSGNHTKQLDQIEIDPKFDSLPSQLLPKMCNSMVSLIQKIVWKLWNSQPLKSWKFAMSNCCLPSLGQVVEAKPQKCYNFLNRQKERPWSMHDILALPSHIYVYLCASCDSNTTQWQHAVIWKWLQVPPRLVSLRLW